MKSAKHNNRCQWGHGQGQEGGLGRVDLVVLSKESAAITFCSLSPLLVILGYCLPASNYR